MAARRDETKALLKEQQALLLARYRAGDVRARDRLIASVHAWVLKVARRYFKAAGDDFDDIVQVGFIAATHALESWDPTRSALITWITMPCNRAIQKYLNESSCAVRFPSGPAGKRGKVRAGGRSGFTSLDEPISDEHGPITRLDMLQSPDPTPEEAVDEVTTQQDHAEVFRSVLFVLAPNERLVIDRRFFDEDRPTLDMIAVELGRTRQRVQQIEQMALQKLRTAVLQHRLGKDAQRENKRAGASFARVRLRVMKLQESIVEERRRRPVVAPPRAPAPPPPSTVEAVRLQAKLAEREARIRALEEQVKQQDARIDALTQTTAPNEMLPTEREAVLEHLASGKGLRATARQFGISRTTVARVAKEAEITLPAPPRGDETKMHSALWFVRSRISVSANELADGLGWSVKLARQTLQNLVRAKKITRVSLGRFCESPSGPAVGQPLSEAALAARSA